MKPAYVFIGCLALVAIAGRELAESAQELGIPTGVVSLLESLALR
jgi:hypothetical protein